MIITIISTIIIMIAYFLLLFSGIAFIQDKRVFSSAPKENLAIPDRKESNFFPHFYPELKGIVAPHQLGYNKKTHILHFISISPRPCRCRADMHFLLTRYFLNFLFKSTHFSVRVV